MKAAVILAGCGYLDGAEIRESVLSLLYLDQQAVQAQCFAPDMAQYDVVDHAARQPVKGTRNILAEAARIARSDVQPLSELSHEAFDMLVLPGGFGVAKNLSDFAFTGSQCEVLPEYQEAIEAFYNAKKPIVAICIAPAILAAALKNKGITVTVGDDADIATAIAAFGNVHQNCPTDGVVVDNAHRIISCSAYMREDALGLIASGIEKAIGAAVAMVKNTSKQAA